MLILDIKGREYWDEDIEEFVSVPSIHVELEHSLSSIYNWEAIWHKPFLHTEMTKEQTASYIGLMVTNNVDSDFVAYLSKEDLDKIYKYLDDKQTATWFRDDSNNGPKKRNDSKIVTAEVIYYWMTALNIPFECDKWFFGRLLTLITVCSEESKPPKKMSKKEMLSQRAALNAARKAKYNSQG